MHPPVAQRSALVAVMAAALVLCACGSSVPDPRAATVIDRPAVVAPGQPGPTATSNPSAALPTSASASTEGASPSAAPLVLAVPDQGATPSDSVPGGAGAAVTAPNEPNTPNEPTRNGTTLMLPGAPGLRLVDASIPYPDSRREEMADYALARYGTRTWRLTPRAIVLHFTESDDDPWSTINFFAQDQPNGGIYPQVCAHFVVGKDGTVYQLVPTDVMCRHVIGLNDSAIGIEVVQSTEGNSSAWADEQILGRPAQLSGLIALVKSLQAQWGIPTDRIIGHGTANEDPLFHDLTGLRNDHTDWGWAAVARFRALVAATP